MRSLDIDPGVAVGIAILAAVPGGTVSNVFTFAARGNVPLSIAVTAVTVQGNRNAEATASEILDRIAISDEDIAGFYNANRAQFNLAEPHFRLAQILITPVRDPNLQNRLGDFVPFQHMLERANLEAKFLGHAAEHQNLILPVAVAMHQALAVEDFNQRFQLIILPRRRGGALLLG